VIAALIRIGWTIERQPGSHRTLVRRGWQPHVFAFHDGEETGPRDARANCETNRPQAGRSLVLHHQRSGGTVTNAEILDRAL
jgi:hypothetical protein